MKKTVKFSICALLVTPDLAFSTAISAQTSTIDYANSPNVDCGSFGSSSTLISGLFHHSSTGYQYVSSGKMIMPGFGHTGSAYEIDYRFKYGHSYRITVEGRSESVNGSNYGTSNAARIELGQISPYLTTSCNFTGAVPNASGNYIGNMTFNYGSYSTYTFNFTMTNYQNVLRVCFPSISSNLVNQLWIRKITITDISVNPPLFNLSASYETKYCGEEKQVTYTVTNVNNTAGVTGYWFELIGGEWKYPNGTPAPSVITSQSNSITLISGPCNPTTTIKGNALIGQINVAADNTRTLTPSTLSPVVTGPNELRRNQEGLFQVMASAYVYNYSWSCAVPYYTWSTNFPNETSLYNSTFNSTNFIAYNVLGGGSGPFPTSKTIQLKATGTMCGVNVEGIKNILVKPISQFAGVSDNIALQKNDQELSIYPNPVTDFLTVEFRQYGESYSLGLYSVEGKLMQETLVNGGKTKLDISKYPAGNYFLKATFNENTQTKMITKN